MNLPLGTLSLLTTFGVGGPPAHLGRFDGLDTLCSELALAEDRGRAVRIIGGGSNLVVADAGIPEHVLLPTSDAITFTPDGDTVVVRAEAGADWDTFVEKTTERGLFGVECLSGIPGRVGATPIQNVGAYGQEVKDTIVRVHAYDRSRGEPATLDASECSFGYRTSAFKEHLRGRYVVLAVDFRLGRVPSRRPIYPELDRALSGLGGAPSPAELRTTVLALRRAKSMVLDPSDENGRSAGSFFVNVVTEASVADDIDRRLGVAVPRFPAGAGEVKIPAAWLIERAGLPRGTQLGPVGLSTKHALAIVAHEGATAKDIVTFAWHVRRRVEEEFGLCLVPEPEFWGFGTLDRGLPMIED